jgi:iron(III) transport system permease protein
MIRAGNFLFLLLLPLVLFPIGYLFYGSFAGGPPWAAGDLSLTNYGKVTELTPSLLNTIVLTVGKTVVTLCIGVYLAWVTARTNTPLRGIVPPLMIIGLLLPRYLMCTGWIYLLSPKIGVINVLLQKLFSLESPPFNIYSWFGLILTTFSATLPYVYLIMSTAFMTMDPAFEESARICGGSVSKVFRDITFPMVRPALLSATLLSIIGGFQAFDSPLYIGLPAGIMVLNTHIYYLTKAYPTDYPLAATASTLVTYIVIMIVVLQQFALGKSRRFVTVSGRQYRVGCIDLGRWKFVASVSILIILTIFPILPLITVLLASFFKTFNILLLSPDNLTLNNYVELFTYSKVIRSFINTFISIPASVGLSVIIGLFVGYCIARTNMKLRGFMENLAMLPASLPSVVLAVALVWTYARTAIYGTILLIVVAFIIYALPYAVRMIIGALFQIHSELEETSRCCGASWFKTFVYIVVPLIKPAIVAAFFVTLIYGVQELSIPIMLRFPGTELASVVIYDLLSEGYREYAAAMGVYVLLIILTLYLAINKLFKAAPIA